MLFALLWATLVVPLVAGYDLHTELRFDPAAVSKALAATLRDMSVDEPPLAWEGGFTNLTCAELYTTVLADGHHSVERVQWELDRSKEEISTLCLHDNWSTLWSAPLTERYHRCLYEHLTGVSENVRVSIQFDDAQRIAMRQSELIDDSLKHSERYLTSLRLRMLAYRLGHDFDQQHGEHLRQEDLRIEGEQRVFVRDIRRQELRNVCLRFDILHLTDRLVIELLASLPNRGIVFLHKSVHEMIFEHELWSRA